MAEGYIDLRDIIEEHEKHPRRTKAEYAAWKDAIEGISSIDFEEFAENSPTAVADWYWREFAEQEFDDLFMGSVPENIRAYIDYDSFAEDLKNDYASVEVEGTTYYVRMY